MTETKTVEKPVTQYQTETKTVEKPVEKLVTKTEYKTGTLTRFVLLIGADISPQNIRPRRSRSRSRSLQPR